MPKNKQKQTIMLVVFTAELVHIAIAGDEGELRQFIATMKTKRLHV